MTSPSILFYVTTENNRYERSVAIDSYGYVKQDFEYLTVNSFSDQPVKLYFRYVGSDGYIVSVCW